MKKIKVLYISSNDKLPFSTAHLSDCGFDNITVFEIQYKKINVETQIMNFLKNESFDVILFDPLLPSSVLNDKSEAAQYDGLAAGGKIGLIIYKKIIKFILSDEFPLMQPKILIYSVYSAETLIKTGFPEEIRNYYLSKPELTSQIVKKIEELTTVIITAGNSGDCFFCGKPLVNYYCSNCGWSH